ncbi:MAG: Dabb family protein [Phycisphaerales bacterium]|nr:Dabb family protein [Planctomycetota bacterium]
MIEDGLMRKHHWLALAIVSLLGACAASPTGPARPARINHLAFFKLKNPADADELVRDCDRKLATIRGVVSYYAGKHLDVGRATVDGDYDVGLYLGFMTEADYAGYVQHPAPIEVVRKWRPRWRWIRVHDVLDRTP